MPLDRIFDDPLISIVIPCFNQANYLGEAIQSARALRGARTEIIAVDDGSTDNTEEVARSYPGIVYIRQRNQGVGAARNTGFHSSSGDFVIFLDQDDRLLLNAVEAGLDCFKEHPRSGFVFGRYRKIDGAGKIISEPTQPPEEADFYLAMLQRNPIGHPAIVLHRRDVLFEMGGFDTTFEGCCDYHLYLRIARRLPIHQHDGIIAEYRWHEHNASRDYNRMLGNVLRVLRTETQYAAANPRARAAMSEGIANWKNHYGELMVYDLRKHLREHGLDRGSVTRLRTMVSCYPQGLASLTKNALHSFTHRSSMS